MDKITFDDLPPEVLKLLENTAVSPPPNGTTSNFVDPPTRVGLQVWTTSVLGAVALVFYLNRLYIKMRLMKSWAWDEPTLFITVLLSMAQYIVMSNAVVKGVLGRHLWDITISQALKPDMAQTSYAMIVLTPWSLLFLKATFFILYIHLFSRIRWIRICSWVGLIYAVVSHGAIGIYVFAVTNPRENQSWANFALKLGVPSGAISLLSDVMIFVLPFGAIIPLELSTAKKIGACAIFLTGGSAIICAILNIYYRYRLAESADFLWDTIPPIIFAICEMFIGIICACVPTISYGFKKPGSIYQRLFFSRKLVVTRIKRPADSMSIESNTKSKVVDTTKESAEESVLSDTLVGKREKGTELRNLESVYLGEFKTEGNIV